MFYDARSMFIDVLEQFLLLEKTDQVNESGVHITVNNQLKEMLVIAFLQNNVTNALPLELLQTITDQVLPLIKPEINNYRIVRPEQITTTAQ